MFCPICSAKIKDNSTICLTCGTRLTEQLRAEAKNYIPETEQKDSKKFKLFAKKERPNTSYNRALLDYADERPGSIVAPKQKVEPTISVAEPASAVADLHENKVEFTVANSIGKAEYTVADPKSKREE